MEKCIKCKNYDNIIQGCLYMDADCENGEKFEPITNYDRIKSMSAEEMAAFIVKSKKIFTEDAYKSVSETLSKHKKLKGYSIEIDNSKVADWEKEEFEIQKQWLSQEVSENDR